ncbi:MAG: hypothetical protein JEZ02_12335 [Desulfatibacillum sp.]|nr:hypothetical protein [Desulfatibacillum sp.]
MASNQANAGQEAPALQPNTPDQPIEAVDMAPLIARAREFLDQHRESVAVHNAPVTDSVLEGKFGFAPKGKGKPEVILAEEVHVELGHPSLASQAMVLTTYDKSLLEHGRVSLAGPDLQTMKPGSRQAFAQIVLLALDRNLMPDPFNLENTQYLMHRLPGYMVRSVPGRLWVRVGRKQYAQGLDLHTVGSALVKAYSDDFQGVIRAEAIFVTLDRQDVASLEPLATEAKVLAGRHKKLALGVDGAIECSELNCEECDEKPVCDNLRDVVVRRRKQRKDGK